MGKENPGIVKIIKNSLTCHISMSSMSRII